MDDVELLDLYSCFPVAVSAIADPFGLRADDPRGLTVTGGLPFFGGPGNAYSLHAIAKVVEALRERPGAHGLVWANGGTFSKHATGVYTSVPTVWRPDDSAAIQAEIAGWPALGATDEPAVGPVGSFTEVAERGGLVDLEPEHEHPLRPLDHTPVEQRRAQTVDLGLEFGDLATQRLRSGKALASNRVPDAERGLTPLFEVVK